MVSRTGLVVGAAVVVVSGLTVLFPFPLARDGSLLVPAPVREARGVHSDDALQADLLGPVAEGLEDVGAHVDQPAVALLLAGVLEPTAVALAELDLGVHHLLEDLLDGAQDGGGLGLL